MKRLIAVVVLSVTLVPSAAPSDLDAMLAPIALYPDSLLAQMLLCAASPGKVSALSEWLLSHDTLKGTDLQNAAVASGFTDSYAALVLFPDVVDYMAGRMDWTAQLGRAFASDRSAVFDSIQRLRKKAQGTGALKTTAQQQVETKTTSGGQQVIVIEPSNPQVVYVPQYNSTTVYTQPSTTVVVKEDNSAEAAVAGMIGFTAGIAIGAAFDNNYYYGPHGWHGGGYMYNDAWDDYYDAREDARDDWQDHREDMYDERSDRAENARDQRSDRAQSTSTQQRTDRAQTRSEGTAATTQQRTERQADRGSAAGTTAGTTAESRGFSNSASATSRDRSGTKSDAFSGYSNGGSERAASSRGERSRSTSRSSGGSRKR